MRHSLRRSSYVVLIVASCIALVACGGSTTSTGGPATGGTASTGSSGSDKPKGDIKVGMVSDQGGLKDGSFNELADKGRMRAESELGISSNVIESKSSSDYEPNMGKFAQQNFSLILAVGFLQADAVTKVAATATNTKFALVDPADDFKPGPNVRGIKFKEQEAGYLAGALAGMVESDGKLKGLNGAKVVSSVGGQNIPPVARYIAGFEAGVKAYCSDCKIIHTFSEDFIAQDKCKEQATTQIGQGSDIIFQVAGLCGLGALDAAKSKGVWGIGVDADQSSLGSHILTSALKKVDVAVFDTIKSVKEGTFQGGAIGTYGLPEDGVGLGAIAPAAQAYEPKIAKVIEDIKAGKITIPSEIK